MRAALVAFAIGASLATTACKKDNPDFCCLSRETCDGHGTVDPIPCTDGRICDEAKYTCVDPHNGGSCSSPDQCSSVTPFCVMGSCVQCQGASDGCSPAMPACEADNACGACSGDQSCIAFASTPHCETSGTASGSCVECRTGQAGDCAMAGQPICDQSQCRACREGECESGFCDVDSGACVDQSDVIYVSTTGTAGSCTKTQPCASFAQGLAAVGGSRTKILVAPGSYSETVTDSDKTVTIDAAGAQLQPAALGQAAMIVTDNGHVTVRGLVIHDAGGGTNADGVRCSLVTSGAPSVALSQVTIRNCSGKAINATSCAVSVDRSMISTNTGGGVVLSDSTFSLINDFIVNNGSTTSSAGGVSIQNIATGGMHVLAFDTIAQNQGADGINSGVGCATVSTPLAFENSIVYGNLTLGSGRQLGGAQCAWSYSNIGDSVSGTGNISQDPKFVSPSTGDFHLMSGSPSIDVANPAATTAIDFDGDTRPQGAHDDQGADEVP